MPNYGNLYDGSFQAGDLVEVVHSHSIHEELQVGCTINVCRSRVDPTTVNLGGIFTGSKVEIRKVSEPRVGKKYFKDWYRETFECQR